MHIKENLTIDGAIQRTPVSIANKPTGGDIAAANVTVDISNSFNINQTTAGQNLTLPTPSVTTITNEVTITNVGTVDFVMYGVTVAPFTSAQFLYTTSWGTISGGASTSAIDTIQNVTVTGNITAWNSSVIVNALSANAQTIPNVTGSQLGKHIIIKNIGTGVTTLSPDVGNSIAGTTTLGQNESAYLVATSVGVATVMSVSVIAPTPPENLPVWSATTAVANQAQRSTTVGTVIIAMISNSARTTGATFNAAEAANWTYLTQSSVQAFPVSSLVLAGFKIVNSGQTYQANTTRVTGATFDVTEQTNWSALSSVAGSGFRFTNSLVVGTLPSDKTVIVKYAGVQTVPLPSLTATRIVTFVNPTNFNKSFDNTYLDLGYNGSINFPANSVLVLQGDDTGANWVQIANGAGGGSTLSENGSATMTAVSVPAGTTSATAVTIPGSTFTPNSTTKYQVSATLNGNPAAFPSGSGTSVPLFALYTNADVLVAGTETQMSGMQFNALNTGVYQSTGTSLWNVDLIAGTTYKIKGWVNGSATGAVSMGTAGFGGQATVKWTKLSDGVGLAAVAGAVQGQIIQADQTADYGNWILLDGRLKSALTTAQQAVATALGYGVNIPDMRGRLPIGANATYPYQTTGGANTIAQNNLPNVALSVSASTSGNAVWTYNGTTGNARISNGGFTFDGSSVGSLAVGGSTSSMNGNVTQQPYTPPYRASNYFVWLGPSASTVTTSQPLTLTTTGSGASTFNSATGGLNIPAVSGAVIGDAKSGFQAGDHAGWIKLDGRLKTTLTTTQQANATSLGIGANLPDATGRSFTQGTLLSSIGSALIQQTDLPNVTLTTVAGGNHTHSYLAANGSATLGVGSGSRLVGEISIRDNTATTTGTGAHTHTVALNGGVTQTTYTPLSVGVNMFVYLGI
jgi:hypothetical protein